MCIPVGMAQYYIYDKDERALECEVDYNDESRKFKI